MNVVELDYELPDDLIAQQPADRRDAARLLVVDRATGKLHCDVYSNIASYLRAGDCMVVNETRVIRARLHAARPSGGKAEIFLLHEIAPGEWEALVKPSAKILPGTTLRIGPVRATVGDRIGSGRRRVVFNKPDVLKILEQSGEVPLPPYIQRDKSDPSDAERYQTIYAQSPGSVAAPTAGLHFTEDVFRSLDAKGVKRATITLHVGYGTFSPIRTDRVEDHVLEPESFMVPQATADIVNATRAAGGRIVAVGTTTTRVLESQGRDGVLFAGEGETAHFIYPPYAFSMVDALQTNFHLPRSSLLALVHAFAGSNLARKAYRKAIAERFRFYSYGDVMLIL
ncbi:MAG: tRNA preQ1(34) S-adenosylmethionine ribosyltransferase-isomerase QueA [Candidatus Hydrogenedentes bacterium]|nr:tRNA preQ1(34) S-adenosylmethionine ribosyltransferase-isomerase QueA [Candidatus Hydrogenedentota bacterium]